MRSLYGIVIAGACLFFGIATTVAAQEDLSGETDVFAPFVSRLRVAVRDPQVRITWRDSMDLTAGRYRVYRYTEEITRDTIDDAVEIAIVDPEVETYLDTPLTEGNYYYAVLAENEEGEIYRIFVPFRNKTIRAVAVTNLETEEDLAAAIYDIEARVQDNAILVRFDASRNGRTLIAYRSTVPFEQLESVADAMLLEEFESSTRRFADYPVPGVDYYYAVFDAALIERGTIRIEPGENALGEPIRITLSAHTDITIEVPRQTKRRAPLPILQLAGGLVGTWTPAMSEVPRGANARVVSSATREAIDALLTHAPTHTPFAPEPHILPEERDVDLEGAAQTLAQIVNNEFAQGRYNRSAALLGNLLELPLSTEFARRVRFYLGQSLYFDGRRESAFFEFLIASEGDLYLESKRWIDDILSSY